MVDPAPSIEVRRSTRRRRTVSAYREGDKIVILMPARTSKSQEQQLITEMVDRVTRREAKVARGGARAGDSQLVQRARQLSATYLEGRAQPVSVRWVTNMQYRWGSCTIADRTIRLSHRLQSMPGWVIDYVLIHELCHLIEPGHDRAFWAWAERYPRTERARGFLEGVAVAAQLPGLSACDSPEPDFGSADSPEESSWDRLPDPADGWPASAEGAASTVGAAPAGSVAAGSSACSAAGLKLVRFGSSNSGICRS